jgi:hypothetical protein
LRQSVYGRIIGMKLIGEGRFTKPEQREASIRFVMGLGSIEPVDRALNASCKNRVLSGGPLHDEPSSSTKCRNSSDRPAARGYW